MFREEAQERLLGPGRSSQDVCYEMHYCERLSPRCAHSEVIREMLDEGDCSARCLVDT